jgi:hypothetical protein
MRSTSSAGGILPENARDEGVVGEKPFSDKSRAVLNNDERRIWYRKGQDNPMVSAPSIKHLPSVIVFVAIGVGFKFDLMLLERSIGTGRYIHNLNRFSLIENGSKRESDVKT